jgi:hypothetical protein
MVGWAQWCLFVVPFLHGDGRHFMPAGTLGGKICIWESAGDQSPLPDLARIWGSAGSKSRRPTFSLSAENTLSTAASVGAILTRRRTRRSCVGAAHGKSVAESRLVAKRKVRVELPQRRNGPIVHRTPCCRQQSSANANKALLVSQQSARQVRRKPSEQEHRWRNEDTGPGALVHVAILVILVHVVVLVILVNVVILVILVNVVTLRVHRRIVEGLQVLLQQRQA